MENCVFCLNVVTEKEAHIFYRNDYVIGFMDKFPVEEGHVLIIPREHYENIFDIDNKIYLEIQEAAKNVAAALRDVFQADGINIGQNNGECAKQMVMHYHLHIIPRHCGREIGWNRLKQTEEELETNCKRIEKRLNEINNIE
ncbi:MAG: HIT family protein [Candidatus Thermoplasmatota archaeon]|nr:HIT family protein [Candidatus Thermoplasmatota archaeon]MCL5889440.1 HIT family protein [Candidatus Thermoplasmatota archaeon]